MLGCFSHVGLFATLWTEVLQTPLCIGFSGIEYWSMKCEHGSTYLPSLSLKNSKRELPWWLSGKESTCQCRRHRLDPRSRKIPHASEQLSPCTTIEPVLWCLGATWRTTEAHVCYGAHAPQQEKSNHSNLRVTCAPQLESSLHSLH